MSRIHTRSGLAAVSLSLLLVASACGGSGEGVDASERDGSPKVLNEGAQLTSDDFVSADPAMVLTVAESQIATALYDGLTEFDYSNADSPEIKPLIAESWEANDTFDEWVFTIGEGHTFSNGDPVLPSSFKYAWERAGSAELASPYGYLVEYLAGGYDFFDQGLEHLDSVVADDEAMTLTVQTEGPYIDFPGLVSMPFFSPLPQDAVEATDDPLAWGNTEMVGNGPFKLDGAATEDSVSLVPNESWSGNVYGDTAPKLDRIDFTINADYDSAFAAFEAGEVDTATIPTGRFADATQTYKNTVGSAQLNSEYYSFGWDDAVVGGEENVKLRQAISLGIDREEIIEKVYGGSRVMPTGLVMPGIPGYQDGVCEYCSYDPEQASKLLSEWEADGGDLSKAVTIDFNTGGGHEDVVALMKEDLADIGIKVELNPGGENYFGDMAEGGCHLCRSGWVADFPAYASFTYDLLHPNSIGLNNLGAVDSAELDALLDDANSESDPAERAKKFVAAESYAVNDLAAVLVVNWAGGSQAYNDNVEGYTPTPLGIIEWERVDFNG